MEIKFVHLADTHLGRRNFKLREREEDFYKAFDNAIEKIIKEKPDFVIHSGDLFEKASPPISSILVAMEGLKKLKENNIPLYIIPGNHDLFLNESFISVLHTIGLLINLTAPEYFLKVGERYIVKGVQEGNCAILGVPGRRSRIKELYNNLIIKAEGKIKIFVFHHILKEVNAVSGDIPLEWLPKGMDYYAGGHWHFPYENYKYRVFYPGSLEYYDVTEMREPHQKGFFSVSLSEDHLKVKFIPVKTRGIKYKRIIVDGHSPEEIEKICLDFFKSLEGYQNIAILELEGRLGKGSKRNINKRKIIEFGLSRGFLHVHINDSKLKDPLPSRKIRKFSLRPLDELEREYLKERFTEEELKLAEEILKTLGQEVGGLELEFLKRKLIKRIEETFLSSGQR